MNGKNVSGAGQSSNLVKEPCPAGGGLKTLTQVIGGQVVLVRGKGGRTVIKTR